MKRRHFLRYSVALALSHSPLYALANGMHKHHSQMSNQDNFTALMPTEAMPAGHTLSGPLPQLVNKSSQQGVFKGQLFAEVTHLRLAGDKETTFWTYNGQLPGPQIEVYEGDTVEIEFINHLPQPTTVHWHGLDVLSEADGNPQDPVEPNGRRIYRFTLPEGSAGTYWYHPHPHGYVSEQVYKGLAGTFVVKSKQDPLAHLKEQHWVLSDLRLDIDGKIPPNTMGDWLNGREGEFVLINGQFQPKMHVGRQERIRIWNATSARYFRLKIDGVKWIVIGTDGGLLEKPRAAVDELFLAPAERVEVVMVGDSDGEVVFQSLYYERQKMMDNSQPTDLTLGKISVQAGDSLQFPAILREFPPLVEPAKVRQVQFSETMPSHANGMGHNSHSATVSTENPVPMMLAGMFLINGKSFEMDRIDFTSKVDQVEQWEIFNNSHMDHPFHIHGTQFEVIEKHYQGQLIKVSERAKKDVVNLRPYEKVTIRFKQGHSGLKMFHCHILEHENLGMMAMLQVE